MRAGSRMARAFLAAPPTFAAKQQPAYDGNVVVSGDRSVTTRACRTRCDDGESARHPVDTHIQEASEDEPENERHRRK